MVGTRKYNTYQKETNRSGIFIPVPVKIIPVPTHPSSPTGSPFIVPCSRKQCNLADRDPFQSGLSDNMDYSIFSYIQRLELMALFSGYPLLYALIHSVAGNRPSKKNRRAEWLIPLLPISYALLGTFYLWLQLRNFY